MAIPLSQYEKVCDFCNTRFITNYVRKKFCSKECFDKKRREWLDNDKKINSQKYVDRKESYRKENTEKNLKEGKFVKGTTEKYCHFCKKKFKPTTYSNIYCSDACRHNVSTERFKNLVKVNGRKDMNEKWNKWKWRQIGYIPKTEMKCVICGEKFIRYSTRSKFCAKEECRLKWNATKAIKKYYENKEKILEGRKKNIEYNIKNRLRVRIRCALKSQRASYTNKTMSLISCSINYLRKYLESKFVDGMNWQNYGRKGWHIDHIKPCCSFDLKDEKQQRECFHYTNLQPLWAIDNLKKSGKVIICEN